MRGFLIKWVFFVIWRGRGGAGTNFISGRSRGPVTYIVKYLLFISVYVFLGSTAGLIDMMTAMESLQLFAKGEYMVIFVDMMTYMPKEALKYLISK